ncbi:uncharacterized protein BKCO1_23000136 [Diplodia corticola]|uniref:DUF1772-domain-containing protein n=1 Tax=Diplodia corticola TaxID=236234 RepID=A0A1J9S1K0_9PEZI|nr:uncharacterized protein BKCO1_23000136 [Diplodia corticola]OJD34463.1 hypothetical protein BKCO1_23000136 [Diplodia corticola]
MEPSALVRTTAILGFSSSIYLSGIYFSSSQLTLPILYRLPSATSTSVFDEFYHRGAVTVVPLALASTLCSGLAAYLQPVGRATFACAGALTIATLGWTRLAMMGTIDALIAAANDERVREEMEAGEVVEKLKTWRWMNMVRAGLSLAGGMAGLIGVCNYC